MYVPAGGGKTESVGNENAAHGAFLSMKTVMAVGDDP
jgi:hypothetical protein